MSSTPTARPLALEDDARRERRRAWVVLAAVLAATLALYARALAGEFVYDDKLLIERNPRITTLGRPLELLASPYWDFLDPGSARQIGYWRPLTALCNALGWALGDGAPWAFHAFGLAVHLAATAVAFLLVRRLVPGVLVAGVAALVFGVHPAHVESVAWISALNDPLFGLFGLLAVERFLAWRQRGSEGLPFGAAVAFALALASKELGAAVLPMCAALDLARRERRVLVRGYAPFLVVLALYLGARMAVFDSPTAGFERETTDFGVSAWRLVLLRVELLGGALEALVVPLDLKLFRAFRPDHTLASPAVLRALAWIAGAAVLGFFLWRRRAPAASFALLLVPAALSPALVKVSSLGSFPLADRFLYVPVLGLGLLLGLACRALGRPGAAALPALVVAGLYAAKAHERIGTWRDEVTVFTTAAEETPRSPYVWWGLGRVRLQRFRETLDMAELDRAFEAFETAQDLLVEAKRGAPDLFVAERDFLQTNLGLGWAWLYRAQFDPDESFATAITLLETLAARIEDIETRAAEARAQGLTVVGGGLELESVYVALGSAYLLGGREEEGEDRLRRALRLAPNDPPANYALGVMLFDRGDFRRAEEAFRRVLAEVPRHVDARMYLARCAFETGRTDEALAIARELEAEGASGSDPAVLRAVAALLANDVSAALAHLDRALELDPRDGFAWYQRGNAFVLRGDRAQALEAYRRAAELMPGDMGVNYQLAALLLQGGAVDAALPYLVRAYTIGSRADLMAPVRETLAAIPVDDPATYLALSRSDRRRGALDQAEAWQDAAAELAPEDPAVLREKARLLVARDREAEAVDWLARLTAAAPDSYEAWSEYGAALLAVGRADDGLAALERARELGPPAAWPEPLRASSARALAQRIEELRAAGPPAPPGR